MVTLFSGLPTSWHIFCSNEVTKHKKEVKIVERETVSGQRIGVKIFVLKKI